MDKMYSMDITLYAGFHELGTTDMSAIAAMFYERSLGKFSGFPDREAD